MSRSRKVPLEKVICAGLPKRKCRVKFQPRNSDHKRCPECGPEWNRLHRNEYARKNRHRFKKVYDSKPEPSDDDTEVVGAYRIHKIMLRVADV